MARERAGVLDARQVWDNKTSPSAANYNLRSLTLAVVGSELFDSAVRHVYFQCVSNRAVYSSRMPFYEYFKPRLTQIVLSAKGKQSDLAHWYFEARSPRSTAFRARVSRPPPPSMWLHIVFIIFPVHHLSSTLDRVPSSFTSTSFILFTHVCAYIYRLFFSLFCIGALSLRMSPLRGSSIVRSVEERFTA